MIGLLEGYGEESLTSFTYAGTGKLKSSGGTATEYFVGNSPSLGSSTVAGYGFLLYQNPNPTNNILDAVKSLGSITSDQIIQQHPELKDALDNINQSIQEIKNRASSILDGDVGLNNYASVNLVGNAGKDGQYAMNFGGQDQPGGVSQQASNFGMQSVASSVDVKQDKAAQLDFSKINEIKNTEIAIDKLSRNPHSKDLYNAHAKEVLNENGQEWTADTNKKIAENMLKNGVKPQRVEDALKHSPEKVENAYYFVKGIQNSSEVQQVRQSMGVGIRR